MAASNFNHLVYDVVRRVPTGRITTYGSIAAALGDHRKAREVGWALYAKPDHVSAPAHRVVNREGALTGGWAFGGPQVQRDMLEAEGVRFLGDGRVDMEAHFWEPDPPGAAPFPGPARPDPDPGSEPD